MLQDVAPLLIFLGDVLLVKQAGYVTGLHPSIRDLRFLGSRVIKPA